MSADWATKIFLSAGNTQKVRILKGRTGLTPNILCRFALALSLRDPGVPDPAKFPSDGMEFNRYTLFGSHEIILLALLRQRCVEDELDPYADLPEQMHAHINRGIGILYPRVRTLSDLGEMATSANVKRGA